MVKPVTSPIAQPHAPAVARSLVPDADVSHLRCHTAASGYRNVYESGRYYVAKVKEGKRLVTLPGSRSTQPHVTARYVVAWYKEKLGADWLLALRCRKRGYWRVSYSKRWGGWLLTVWGNGQARTWRERDGRNRWLARPLVFAERDYAEAFALKHLPGYVRAGDWAAYRA